MSKYFVILKTKLDFEGYPVDSDVISVKDTLTDAEKHITTLPKPTLCHCGEHSDFEYRIKVSKV